MKNGLLFLGMAAFLSACGERIQDSHALMG